jgi:glucose/mannose transport system substrate-binding protein
MKKPAPALAALLLCMTVSGCGTSNAIDAPSTEGSGAIDGLERPLVELFSWWTAPGEAEALQTLIEEHRRLHPDARLFNAAAASGSKARDRLAERLSVGDPPDLFQNNAHDLPAFVAKHPGQLRPLDDLVDELALRQSFYPELIPDVTLDGHVYGMPVNVHRENALFFNQRLLRQHGLRPPQTLDELLTTCRVLKANGVVPIATSFQGWILRIMFNSIAMGKMGSEHYYRYFTGSLPPDDATLRQAIDVFADVLENYTNPDAGEDGFGWTNAAQAVYTGDAALFFHGDWVKGYFMQLGWSPGEDFGVVAAPGGQGLFLYGVDVFSLPHGAPNERGALAFLSTVASLPGQVVFNNLKGSSPTRSDIALERLDPVARATVQDLQQAERRMLLRGREAWDNALAAFARSRDRQALFRAYVDNPPSSAH